MNASYELTYLFPLILLLPIHYKNKNHAIQKTSSQPLVSLTLGTQILQSINIAGSKLFPFQFSTTVCSEMFLKLTSNEMSTKHCVHVDTIL